MITRHTSSLRWFVLSALTLLAWLLTVAMIASLVGCQSWMNAGSTTTTRGGGSTLVQDVGGSSRSDEKAPVAASRDRGFEFHLYPDGSADLKVSNDWKLDDQGHRISSTTQPSHTSTTTQPTEIVQQTGPSAGSTSGALPNLSPKGEVSWDVRAQIASNSNRLYLLGGLLFAAGVIVTVWQWASSLRWVGVGAAIAGLGLIVLTALIQQAMWFVLVCFGVVAVVLVGLLLWYKLDDAGWKKALPGAVKLFKEGKVDEAMAALRAATPEIDQQFTKPKERII